MNIGTELLNIVPGRVSEQFARGHPAGGRAEARTPCSLHSGRGVTASCRLLATPVQVSTEVDAHLSWDTQVRLGAQSLANLCSAAAAAAGCHLPAELLHCQRLAVAAESLAAPPTAACCLSANRIASPVPCRPHTTRRCTWWTCMCSAAWTRSACTSRSALGSWPVLLLLALLAAVVACNTCRRRAGLPTSCMLPGRSLGGCLTTLSTAQPCCMAA